MSTLSILTKGEEKALGKVPQFTSDEKTFYFRLPDTLSDDLIAIDDDSNKALLILMFGYFKAMNRFFRIEDDDPNLQYVIRTHHLKEVAITNNPRTVQRYKRRIKAYLGINEYSQAIEIVLLKEAIRLAGGFVHRKKIFYALVELSKRSKIEIPSYTELSRIISNALNHQKMDILTKLATYLTDERLSVLDDLLAKDKDYKNRYVIMQFKRLEHSNRKNQIIHSLNKLKTIKTKFDITESIMKEIGISPTVAQYYARWIEKSQVFQVKRKHDLETYFLLLSFVYYQYLIRNDNLIDRFISTVQTAKNASYRAQKEFSFAQEPNKNRVIRSLEDSSLSILNEIDMILKDGRLSAIRKVASLERLVRHKMARLQEILVEKEALGSSTDNRFDFIEKSSKSLQVKLSGILKVIEFDKQTSDGHIIAAIDYFKKVDGNILRNAPKGFLDPEEEAAVFGVERFRVSLYKVLLLFHVSDAIKSGVLNLRHSYRYQDFDSYLIDHDEWVQSKDDLLRMHGLEGLKDFDAFIAPIKKKLETNYKKSNRRIIADININFRSTTDSFILKTPKVDKEDDLDNTISKYLPQGDYLSIIDVLSSIEQKTGFLDSFQHFSNKKSKSDHKLLLAAVLGYGCNINIAKMGKISKGINEDKLNNTKVWYFTEENTIEANDKVIRYMEELEIVKLLRDRQGINHTSSDGQKFNIRAQIDSVNAGYSFKYFGTAKGVSVYTFIDESHRLFHSKVINVSERESGYVIDGLMHNEVVKSDIHSTDTHGFSEVIFGLTHLLGFSFAPRIKNFKDQQLYSFHAPKEYHRLGYVLLPKRRIKEAMIKESWDTILRFIVTIKSRKTTTSQLLKRLTSYSRQHRLYIAIKEFGKTIKTDFLLTYIDDVELRQRIEKQLNKVEASNKFSKAVFFGNNAEFQVSTAEEQNIANNSKRLIQNAIILWNYLYLTKRLQQVESLNEKDKIIRSIQNGSIVHWSHINLYGEYDFTRRSKKIDALIAIDEEEKGVIN